MSGKIRKWWRFAQLLAVALFWLPTLIWSYASDWDQEWEEF